MTNSYVPRSVGINPANHCLTWQIEHPCRVFTSLQALNLISLENPACTDRLSGAQAGSQAGPATHSADRILMPSDELLVVPPWETSPTSSKGAGEPVSTKNVPKDFWPTERSKAIPGSSQMATSALAPKVRFLCVCFICVSKWRNPKHK